MSLVAFKYLNTGPNTQILQSGKKTNIEILWDWEKKTTNNSITTDYKNLGKYHHD